MTTEAITNAAKHAIKLERAIAKLKAELDETKAELLTLVGEGSVETPVAKVTVVAPTTRTIDLDTLRTILGPKKFGKVTKQAIDWKSFDILADLGDIPREARQLVVTGTGTTYVKVTAR
jgi:hypothetical protein